MIIKHNTPTRYLTSVRVRKKMLAIQHIIAPKKRKATNLFKNSTKGDNDILNDDTI